MRNSYWGQIVMAVSSLVHIFKHCLEAACKTPHNHFYRCLEFLKLSWGYGCCLLCTRVMLLSCVRELCKEVRHLKDKFDSCRSY